MVAGYHLKPATMTWPRAPAAGSKYDRTSWVGVLSSGWPMIARQKFAKPVPDRHATRPDLTFVQGPVGPGDW
jgi:hypothetical protein